MPTDSTVVNAMTQKMRCHVCGDEVPIPLGAVSWVVAVMTAFAAEHRSAQHRPGRTLVAKDAPQVAKDSTPIAKYAPLDKEP